MRDIDPALHPFSTISLPALMADFERRGALLELAVLAACVAIAWVAARAFGRHRNHDSVWIGKRVVDGVLFPAVLLASVYAALFVVLRFQPAVILRVAVPVLVSLLVIRLVARVLAVSFPQSAWARAIERIFSWVAWLVAVLWIVGLLQPVLAELDAIGFSLGKSRITLRSLIEGTLSSALVLVLVLWLSAVLEKRLMKRQMDASIRQILMNVLRTVLLAAALLFTLSAVGVDLTVLSVFGGAIGVGLGLGLQKLAANYVSGFVILFERKLRIGDAVKVDTFEGTITDINTRYTLIRAGNGRESIVPNETLVTTRVENLTQYEAQFGLTTEITVAPDSDADRVIAILQDAARSQPRVIAEPAPAAYLTAFIDRGLTFTLHYWIADFAAGQANVRSAVQLAALRGLRDAGIGVK